MKKIITVLIFCIIAITASAQSSFFKKCEDYKGVSSVYISKAMLQFAGTDNIDCGNVNISSLASKLDGIEIINADSHNMETVSLMAKDMLQTSGCEKLMQVKDNEETVNMYLRNLPKGRTEFIIIAKERQEISVIILSGTMTIDEVVKAVKNN